MKMSEKLVDEKEKIRTKFNWTNRNLIKRILSLSDFSYDKRRNISHSNNIYLIFSVLIEYIVDLS